MRQTITSGSDNSTTRRRIPAKRKITVRAVVRCLVFALGFALLLLLAASWTARLRFQALVNERHRAGERVVLEDFQTAPLPDDQNAATYLERAANCFTLDSMLPWVYYGISHYELPDSARSTVRQIFSEHPEILQLLRQADSCDKADWHQHFRSPVFKSVYLKFIKRQGVLGQVLYPYGVDQHELGNDLAALECVEHLLTIARAIDQLPDFGSHCAGCSFDEYAAQLCLRVSPKLPSAAATSNLERDEFNRLAKKLIAEFLDDDSRIYRAKQAWFEHRMQMVDGRLNPGASAVIRFVDGPYLYWGAREEIPCYDALLCACQTKRWNDARDIYRSRAEEAKFTLFDEYSPPFNGLRPQFESMTARHAAAIALALRLYADDHDGQYPADLQSLVPRYLSSIPSDSFGAPGAPLKYLPGTRPAIYSVSYDGIDSHGDRSAWKDPGGGPRFNPWEARDAVFPLGGTLLPADQLPEKVVLRPRGVVRAWHGPH